jgi:hypothetical protein
MKIRHLKKIHDTVTIKPLYELKSFKGSFTLAIFAAISGAIFF